MCECFLSTVEMDNEIIVSYVLYVIGSTSWKVSTASQKTSWNRQKFTKCNRRGQGLLSYPRGSRCIILLAFHTGNNAGESELGISLTLQDYKARNVESSLKDINPWCKTTDAKLAYTQESFMKCIKRTKEKVYKFQTHS